MAYRVIHVVTWSNLETMEIALSCTSLWQNLDSDLVLGDVKHGELTDLSTQTIHLRTIVAHLVT